MTTSERVQNHHRNTVFCLQGAPSDSLFVLRDGRIGVYINDSKHPVTAEQVLESGTRVATISQTGSIVGEGGLFVPQRTASLVALSEPTRVEHVPLAAEGLRQVLVAKPEFGLKLCRCLASRLSELLGQVKELVTAADMVEQAYDEVAVLYRRIVDELADCAQVQAALLPVVEHARESILYLHAESLEQYHHETVRMFQCAASNKRHGTLKLAKDEVLCEEGSLGRSLYLVRSGRLSVEVGGTIVGSIGPGEVVGEVAVLLKELPKRTATVRATTDTQTNIIATSRFYELAAQQPEFLIPIARRLAARLDRTNQFLLSRHKASAYNARSLAGDPLSCADQLSTLARKLIPFEEVAYLREELEKNAEEVELLCKKMDKQVSGEL